LNHDETFTLSKLENDIQIGQKRLKRIIRACC